MREDNRAFFVLGLSPRIAFADAWRPNRLTAICRTRARSPLPAHERKENGSHRAHFLSAGGQGGIRTLETVRHRLHTFQACAFNRSATCPKGSRHIASGGTPQAFAITSRSSRGRRLSSRCRSSLQVFLRPRARLLPGDGRAREWSRLPRTANARRSSAANERCAPASRDAFR